MWTGSIELVALGFVGIRYVDADAGGLILETAAISEVVCHEIQVYIG